MDLATSLLRALRDRLAGIGIENQEIALIALGVLAEIEHLGDGIWPLTPVLSFASKILETSMYVYLR